MFLHLWPNSRSKITRWPVLHVNHASQAQRRLVKPVRRDDQAEAPLRAGGKRRWWFWKSSRSLYVLSPALPPGSGWRGGAPAALGATDWRVRARTRSPWALIGILRGTKVG